MVGNWIYDENLRLFMEALAHFAGAAFEDEDWVGVEQELFLRRDEVAGERRADWPLGDRVVRLFYEPGSSAVSFQVEADPEFEIRADTLVYPLQQVVVRPDR